MKLKLLIILSFLACPILGQESSTLTNESDVSNSNTFTEDEFEPAMDLYDDGKMYEETILSNNDTLLVTRTYGDHFYGLFAGPNLSLITGNVRWAANPLAIAPGDYPEPSRGDVIVDYTPIRINENFNWFPGFIYEYSPVDWDFGFALRVFPFETVLLRAEFLVPEEDATRENEKYIFTSRIPYTGISPQLTYKIRYLNLKLWAGADVFFSIGNDETQIERDYITTSGDVEVPRIIRNLEDPPLRYGFNTGIEYEFLVMDIFKSTRVKFAPYFMAEWTTSYISDFGSSVSPIIVRAGLAIKLGPDRIKTETLKYVPKINNDFLAKFDEQRTVSFGGFIENEELVSSSLDYIEVAQVQADITDEPSSKLENTDDLFKPQVSSEPEEEEEEKENKLSKGQQKIFTFKNISSTTLSKELRDYLKGIATWLKNNPNVEIRVVGHASADEPQREAQQLSNNRALKVQSYLQRQGIQKRRVLVGFQGARSPRRDVDNRTAAGRAANRRVEIELAK
ncbi:OmpA family protein [Candidatus Kapabacteria bacterium]|nr:OmpA family protein [Candidatus Kapabacteria bacterium]